MVFSSGTFLLVFLPLFALVYGCTPRRWRGWVLLLASLIFYACGEKGRVLLLIGCGIVNGAIGLALARTTAPAQRRTWVTVAVVANLTLLGCFKYLGFLAENVRALVCALGGETAWVPVPQITLPMGISFFVFQGLSYVLDVYRREIAPAGLRHVLTYLSLFPQLVAGPIVRYRDVGAALLQPPRVPLADLAQGASRFVRGLAKKVLLADVLADGAAIAFACPPDELGCSLAWVGAISYTLQIYFDFSGYSDMAIGLGRMMGFTFPENFLQPYLATSVRDFWRRWHCSLSTWFRDYLYIPLGGNRCSPLRTAANLLIVFLLTGLWHGASWTFVGWGLWHGLWLAAERFGASYFTRLPSILHRSLTLLVVMVGWVLFRAESFPAAANHLRAMAGFATANTAWAERLSCSWGYVLVAAIALLACLDWRPIWTRLPNGLRQGIWIVGTILLLLMAFGRVGVTDYSPFLYFRF